MIGRSPAMFARIGSYGAILTAVLVRLWNAAFRPASFKPAAPAPVETTPEPDATSQVQGRRAD